MSKELVSKKEQEAVRHALKEAREAEAEAVAKAVAEAVAKAKAVAEANEKAFIGTKGACVDNLDEELCWGEYSIPHGA